MDFERAYKWLVKSEEKEYLFKDSHREEKLLLNKSVDEGFIFNDRFQREYFQNNTFVICDVEQYIEVEITKKQLLKGRTKFYQFNSSYFETEQEYFYRFCTPFSDEVEALISFLGNEKEQVEFVFKKLNVLLFLRDSRLIIESLCKIRLKEFKHTINSLLLSLGYFSRTFLNEEKFYFQSKTVKFEEVEFSYINSKGIVRSYLKPVENDIKGSLYKYLDRNKNYDKFNFKDYTLLKKCLETLVDLAYENKEYYLGLSLLKEAHKAEINTRPIILFPVFESLCRKVNDSSSKKLDNNIEVEELKGLNILEKYKKQIPEKDYLEVKKALKPNNLRSYENAFRRLEQNVSERDQEFFKLRNKLLHGRLTNKKLSNEVELVEMSKLYLSYYYHIYTLISRIILQEIGFKGFVIQHHELRKVDTNQTDLNEELFFEIK